ncbi:beta-lactamase/transpeptidase-like protein [Auriculariales sp. MPI-PUGE-AT-0066]|nr:beta-lactamase/transpeptidase-like protein [Auriculariales sp. MPI-PUGE-AT-0066]
MRLAFIAAFTTLAVPRVAQAYNPFSSATFLSQLSELDFNATRSLAPLRTASSLISSEIDAFIRETMALWDVQGLQLAVVQRRPGLNDEWDVDTRAYGVMSRNGTPMTTNTLFPIASNSKQFTAAAIGLLVSNESSPLTWSSKMKSLLPEFELQDVEATEYANIVDLLTHRTGLPRHDLAMPIRKDGSLSIVGHMKASAEFREVWQYNNHMYNIAATLVERLSGIPFFDFVKNNIFEKAGFEDTHYYSPDIAASGRVTEGFCKFNESASGNGTLIATTLMEKLDVKVHGAGAAITNVEDIVLWMQTLLNDGKSPKTGKQVIPANILAKMSSGITVVNPGLPYPPELGPTTYGLAFEASSYQGHQFVEHGGSLPGYHSQITRFPNDGLGIAILVNEDLTFTYQAIKHRIAEDLLGLPIRVDWNTRFKTAYAAALWQMEEIEKGRIPSPSGATPPSVPLSQLVGTYTNGAYGQLTFSLSGAALYSHASDDLTFVHGFTLGHFDGNLFNLTVSLFLTEIGKEKPLIFNMSGLAEFAFEEGVVTGVGMWGGLWGAGFGSEALPMEGTAYEKAEVWFQADRLPWNEVGAQSVFHV